MKDKRGNRNHVALTRDCCEVPREVWVFAKRKEAVDEQRGPGVRDCIHSRYDGLHGRRRAVVRILEGRNDGASIKSAY